MAGQTPRRPLGRVVDVPRETSDPCAECVQATRSLVALAVVAGVVVGAAAAYLVLKK